MKNNQKNIDVIFDLLLSKKSDKFNDVEKKIVNEELNSIKEFENLKLVSDMSFEYFENEDKIIPDPIILNRLKQEIQKNKSKKRSIITFSVPAYQAVAACLAIFMFSWMFFKSGNIKEPKERVKYVTVEKIIIDTIKIAESAAPQIALSSTVKLIESRTHIIKNTINKIAKNNQTEEIDPNNMFVGFRNLKHLENQKRGVNIADDSILRKFRFTILSRN